MIDKRQNEIGLCKKVFLGILISINFFGFAQTKGIVTDSISGKPIPYVSIWIENQNQGTTSEENGEFTINTSSNANLIFSALGFEKKKVKFSQANEVKLKPTSFELQEVLVSGRKQTREREIGEVSGGIFQAFDSGLRIDIKHFPYFPSYKKTKFIKKVTIYADSRIENASIKIHFYSVATNGFPDQELLKKDLIVTVKKGTRNNVFDVSDFNLIMPINGIFVGFERLLIEKNKIEKTRNYAPFVLSNRVEKEVAYNFSGGKWNLLSTQNNSDLSGKMMIYEPAINMILSN